LLIAIAITTAKLTAVVIATAIAITKLREMSYY
jgi:hypothetical protein